MLAVALRRSGHGHVSMGRYSHSVHPGVRSRLAPRAIALRVPAQRDTTGRHRAVAAEHAAEPDDPGVTGLRV